MLLQVALLFSAALSLLAQEPAAAFPVKRVALYKNGVGYFEHAGRVQGDQQVAIGFTSGQLNDVLKSLTVLDLGAGRVTSVTYGSNNPTDRRLGELRLPIGEKTSLTDFLGALRGARLEIRTPAGTVSGRLLSVECKARAGGGTTLEIDFLSLVTDSGEVKTAELSSLFSVRFLDRDLAAKVDQYLNVMASTREGDLRRMVISTSGTGERPLFVSYISEVPVWKTTYRVVLGKDRKPLLQGWAIVDNTVGEDWENVELSLYAGAPQSFVQQLSQPFFSRRPEVPLPEQVSSQPQTYQATLVPAGGPGRVYGWITDQTGVAIGGARVRVYAGNQVVAEAVANAIGRYDLGPLPYGEVRLEVEAQGFQRGVVRGVFVSSAGSPVNATLPVGSVSESVEIRASMPQVNTSTSSTARADGTGLGSGRALGSVGGAPSDALAARAFAPPAAVVAEARMAAQSEAVAQQLGDLFEYKLKKPVTIRKNQSALVPIVQTPVEAEKVSIWNASKPDARPRRGLWLTNAEDLTLDGGSFGVIEEETFAGEGIFDPIRPAEKRLISYAVDLALSASSRRDTRVNAITRVRVRNGILTHEREQQLTTTYTLRNEDKTARTVIVEHPITAGYQLQSGARPIETTRDQLRFRLPVAAKETAVFTLTEVQPIASTVAVSELDSDRLAVMVQQKSISPAVEAALRRVLAQKAVLTELQTKNSLLEQEQTKIFDDQQRLRENMKALKGTAEEKPLLQRYTQQLNRQEDRLEAIAKESEALEARIDEEARKVNELIDGLAFDEKL